MTNTTIITGIAAIEYAEQNGLLLNKYNDPVEDARTDLSIEEAREVASEDPSLIWVEAGKTAAETIADMMGNDGQRFEAADGKPLDKLCEEHGATAERWEDEDGRRNDDDPIRYAFPDGSAIVIAGAGWDVEGAEPFSWASE